ncbi:uncharacterized protein [Nicotiana sylvestris]|uniref:uncharacterized protein n=1 Tax=Nicotiana sylvestris TaxID=4096 RepID=UPI00388CD588
MAWLEEDLQHLQEQNHAATQVLEARSRQIGRLLQEKGIIRERVRRIANYITMKCSACEDMTRSMFFAPVMIFVRLIMEELYRLQDDMDAWSNGREPPSAIPGFPELFPRVGGASNIPISHPNTPLGYPTISAHFVGTPSEVRPQVLASGATSSIFTAPPSSATTHPTLPRPNFDPSSFTFLTSSFPLEPVQFPTYTYSQPPRYEFTAGQEKTTKTPEQEEIARKMRSMDQSLKSIQGLSGQKSVSYADLCMFPHVHLPLGFKTPKFEKYDGHNDLISHLKRYCNQLRGAGGKEELLMAYFRESLVGITSEWYMDQDISRWYIWDDLARDFVRQFQYNIDIAPVQNSLTNLKKKSSESFREYAVKWREQASRVKPPMDEPVPSNRQNPESPSYQRGTRCAYHSGAEGHDTENCWTLKRAVEDFIEQRKIVLRDEDITNVTNNQLPAHNNGPVIGMICEDKEFDPALKAIIAIDDVEKKSKAAPKQDKGEKKNKTTPPESEKKFEVETGAMPPKDVVLYVLRGCKEKKMTLSPPMRLELNKTTQIYVPKGAYMMREPINPPRLSEPVVIGRAPQKPMTNPAAVPWNYNKSVVTFKGKEISREAQENNPVEKYFNLEEVNNATRKRFPSKKPVSAEEAEAFFQKMKMADYEVIDQLQKSSAQVSLLSLLMNSNEHQKVLIKTLNEAYVPVETSVEQLERMAERYFAINLISFTKNNLPPEGAAHNKALHLTVKCEGYYVKKVMLDGGSGVDICPLSTLQHMEIGTERIRPNNVCVRAFDGCHTSFSPRPRGAWGVFSN